jgi:hypothetical protein
MRPMKRTQIHPASPACTRSRSTIGRHMLLMRFAIISCRLRVRLGKLRPDGGHDVEATEIRKAEVQQDHVGSQGAIRFNPFPAVGGSSSQRHVGLAVDNGPAPPGTAGGRRRSGLGCNGRSAYFATPFPKSGPELSLSRRQPERRCALLSPHLSCSIF